MPTFISLILNNDDAFVQRSFLKEIQIKTTLLVHFLLFDCTNICWYFYSDELKFVTLSEN